MANRYLRAAGILGRDSSTFSLEYRPATCVQAIPVCNGRPGPIVPSEELREIVPRLPSLPVQTIPFEGEEVYGMFESLSGYASVLPPCRYRDTDQLLESLEEKVIGPALTKAEEIAERRRAFEAELGKRP